MTDERDGLVVRVLGPITVARDGQPSSLGGPLLRRLLAALVVNRDLVVPIGRLQDRLWGHELPETATATLRSHLSRLRSTLPDSVELLAVAPGYRLGVRQGALDADRFAELIARAREQLPDGPELALTAAETALALWRGPFLAEFAEEPWVLAQGERFDELLLLAREVRIEALLGTRQVDAAVSDARLLAAAHPVRERAWIALVRALDGAGHRREALACAHQYRTQLREASGLTPSALFAALERDLLATEPKAPPPTSRRPDAAGTSGPAGSGSGGAATTETALRPGQLPSPFTSFHGREREGDDLASLLRTQRCVTLTGAGGMGKTRLALHAAARCAAAFPDGMWFAALADIAEGDPEAVPYALAEALGLRPERGLALLDAIAEWIGDRRALLMLDNCEHVLSGAVAAVDRLLYRCPNLTVMATSRRPLHMAGEHRVPVGPLDAGPARSLFLDRVRAYDPAAPASLHLDDVAALCEQLANIPLALELAAARCRATSPRELAWRLRQRPELLGDGGRPGAQQTLTAVLNWSVEALSSSDRRAFAQLAVFHGGFRLDAAERVIGGSGAEGDAEVLGALERLVDAGLLVVARLGSTVRYLLLEPVRQHAERMLDAAQRSALAHRHAATFAEWATDIGRGLRGSDFGDWLEIADHDLPNLRAAHRWALGCDRPEIAVAISAGVREYFNERLITELADWCDASVAVTRGRGDRLEAAALAAACTAWLNQRRYSEVYAACDRIRLIDDAEVDSRCLAAWAAGWSKINSGEPAQAAPIWRAALREGPSPWYEALLHASLTAAPAADRRSVEQLLARVASPSLQIWYQIWSAKIMGPAERLEATDAVLAGVIEHTRRLGAIHPHGVALYLQAFVAAQRPERSLGDVLDVLDQAIVLWSDQQVPDQMLTPALEGLAFTLAQRGAPEAAHTIFAVVDSLGGTLWLPFRARVAPMLDVVPPATAAACRARAAHFGNLREAADFARGLIRSLVEDRATPQRGGRQHR